MVYRLLLVFFSTTLCNDMFAQQLTQTIRGHVFDMASNAPVPFANVVVLGTNPLKGMTTDLDGNFSIPGVPLGRYDVQVSFTGYESSLIKEVQVLSAKEVFLPISIREYSIELNEIIVRSKVNKAKALNTMASVSARMLSVDEASRYAGGFDDPARLAASFAGVASNVGNNGIVVRGNSPKSLQWKLEGVEIPNPNHFADLSAFGGGGLTALSTKMLANSDFLTGAFPAEYGNALSGVFDIFMRKGNNEKPEHSLQIGVIGIEAGSEGPFKKGTRSSYLFNYRYSTLGLIAPLLPDNGGGVTYQDLSFKLNFPTKKAGTFSVWGIGLIDRSGQIAKADSSEWVYNTDKEAQEVKQYMAASGLTHKYFFNNNIYLKTTLAATVNGIDLTTDRMNTLLKPDPENRINNQSWDFVLSSFVNNKINSKHTNKTGIILTGLRYDLLLKEVVVPGDAPQTLVSESGFSTLLSAYSNSMFNFTNKLTMNLGVHAQLFTLNKNAAIEPRIGFKWQFRPTQTLGLAYGLHSRLERLNYYFTKDIVNNKELYNKNLDFTKAHHLVFSYDLSINENTHLKIELYFQQLFNVPVIADSSLSFINLQNDWFFNHKLENTGEGRNIGIDITLEKYLSKGFYFMNTASIFNSRYKGGDRIWRDTRYNRNYLFNFLIGKEWQFGKNNGKIVGANLRFSYQGGDHYSPVNTTSSHTIRDIVFDETKAFSRQLPSSFTGHVTINYKWNRIKTSHEIALKVINATMFEEFTGFRYNLIKHSIETDREAIFIPNLSYKIEF